MLLSVVIPAYNESARLKKTLPQILNFFKSQKFKSELIIVDDGSSDNTSALAKKIIGQRKSAKVITQSNNLGKGGALRAGVLAAQGDYILFMDADLSTPLKELDKFWPFTSKFQVLIGSRKTTGAEITKHQGFLRENLGKVFTLLTNLLATKNLTDITCGFKMFERRAGQRLFKIGVINDWSFDAEILFLAQKYGYKIVEIPVSWQNDPRTKVNMLKDGLNALLGLLKIRLFDTLGRYD